MTFAKTLFVIIIILTACNQIKTGDKLGKTDIERIEKLNLLDKDEAICKFYSEFKNKVAGNFFTNKRIATYWIDERDKSKNKISSAFYRDIKSIDTIYYAGLTYSPYLLVTKNDNTEFKVYVNGKQEEIKTFFEDALNKWTLSKSPN